MIIMNVLNEVWSDIYILQIVIQQEFQGLTKILHENVNLKTQNLSSKLETFTKLKKTIVSELVLLVIKIRENIQSICQKILLKDMLIYYWYKKKTKCSIFLSKILVHSYMITHFTTDESIFVIIVYWLLM